MSSEALRKGAQEPSREGAAAGAVRALDGTESVMTYTGEPSWDGFKLSGAPRDVEE